MFKILQARLQQYVNHELPDVQAGFRKGIGSRDQIANICRIIEKNKELQKNIYFCCSHEIKRHLLFGKKAMTNLLLLLSHSVMSDYLQPRGLQHTRHRSPSLTPRVYSDLCLLSRWYHPPSHPLWSPFSSHLQSFPASGSFPMSQFFASGGQSIGVSASASILPMNIQDWFHLGCTGWISLLSKGLSRVLSNTTVQKH